MSKKIADFNEGGEVITGKKELTKFQVVFILFVMFLIASISIGSMLTYSVETVPGEEVFNNSQTIKLLQ